MCYCKWFFVCFFYLKQKFMKSGHGRWVRSSQNALKSAQFLPRTRFFIHFYVPLERFYISSKVEEKRNSYLHKVIQTKKQQQIAVSDQYRSYWIKGPLSLFLWFLLNKLLIWVTGRKTFYFFYSSTGYQMGYSRGLQRASKRTPQSTPKSATQLATQ